MRRFTQLTGSVTDASVVTFGCFDGLHAGHRAVLETFCSQRGDKVVLSYEEKSKPVVYTEEEKAHLLSDLGIDAMISIPVAEVDGLTADTFARAVLKEQLRAQTVVVGENLRFGADGADPAVLAALGARYGFRVVSVPTVRVDGEVVSTDRLVQAINAGDFGLLQRLLGHPYIMHGTVIHGKAAGRKFGMPTANLGVADNKMFPPHGVYGTLSYMDDGTYRGMTNVGLRPSDDDIPIPSVETFLLNFDRDIYGKEVFLEFHVYTRGVKKFPGGLAELRRQIDLDIEHVREYMEKVTTRR